MNGKANWKMAASALAVVTTLAGCSSLGLPTRSSAQAEPSGKSAAWHAAQAGKAIAARNVAGAIASAESAVAGDGNNADYRMVLGRAYLMAGRYESARTAFNDAMTLGNREPRAIISLALINVAQGNVDGARSVLSSNMDVLPAADYGLAMAMAGAPEEAIRILSRAIHEPAAGAKERQNLAYAYAIAGRWSDARVMAAQDLPPLEAARRVMGWAEMSEPGSEGRRVIAMLGVQPVANDAGLPVALALNGAGSSGVDLAYAPRPVEPVQVEEASEPQAQQMAQAPQPRIENAPIQTASPSTSGVRFAALSEVVQPIPSSRRARVQTIRAPKMPARQAVASAAQKPVAVEAVPQSRQATLRPVSMASGTAWVVQLGAFDSADIARASWQRMISRNGSLRSFPIVTSTVNVKGRTFHRVAVAGFGDRDGAVQLCGVVKAQGGTCFVRMGGPEAAPRNWATNAQWRQVAMR